MYEPHIITLLSKLGNGDNMMDYSPIYEYNCQFFLNPNIFREEIRFYLRICIQILTGCAI